MILNILYLSLAVYIFLSVRPHLKIMMYRVKIYEVIYNKIKEDKKDEFVS